jgi:exoribonuclease-2
LSREHWKLVYLQQHPDWRGDAVLVDRWDRRGKAIIPALALETSINLREDLPLNSELTLSVSDVSLPNLEAYFRIV